MSDNGCGDELKNRVKGVINMNSGVQIDPLKPPIGIQALVIIHDKRDPNNQKIDVQGPINDEIYALGLLSRAAFIIEEYHARKRLTALPEK